jgi:hypothetical protein
MTDILAQIGDKLGSKVKELQAQINALDDGGGGHNHDPVDSYTESTFTNGVLTAMTTWTSSLKSTLISSKAFTYTSGNLTSVVEKDGSDVTTLTKTLTYDSSGNLESVTKDYA